MYDLVLWPGLTVASGTLPEMWELANGTGDAHIFCGTRRVLRNAGSQEARYWHLKRARKVNHGQG